MSDTSPPDTEILDPTDNDQFPLTVFSKYWLNHRFFPLWDWGSCLGNPGFATALDLDFPYGLITVLVVCLR